MTVRKILVPVDGSESQTGALETAFALAGDFAAHIAGLHVRIDPMEGVAFVGEGMSGALVQELIELTERESDERARTARAMFERVRTSAGFPAATVPTPGGPSAAWLEQAGREEDAIIRYGRLADLIVVGRTSADRGDGAVTTLNMGLFETGRPVLVAGENARAPFLSVVVAWNGSREAARAVAAALPFLARASQVTALSVDEDEAEHGLDDLVEYFGWHGIAAQRRRIETKGSIGEALARAAFGADLLVMGGYSHSRLRELILGGVTRHMLAHATLPLLMAH